MSCRIDIETAILDQVFNEVVEDRNTYTREGDNVIVINSKADNSKSKTSNRQAAYKIAQERLDYIKKSFKGQVTGTISETNDYEPIKIKLFVKPEYIEYEYSKLPEEQQTDSKDYLNLEDEGNYTTNEEGDVIIKNEEVLGLPNELSQSEITQEPIDYSQEPKFRKNNPDFDSERYVNDQGKFGKVEAPLDESLTPFLSETREKAQQYSAEFIADSFKSKDKPNERKFNRPTNLPESFRLVWGEVDSNKFNALATDELGGILRWVRRMDRQNSKEQSIPFVKGVMGRDAKSIYSENGGNDVDTKTRYGILRVIQSINDSDVLLGIFRRLGMGEIRVINNKRLNSLFVHNGSLYINEAKWSENLQDKFNKGINLDEYIDVAVFEELIHLIVGKLTNNKTILEASEELDDNDKSIINKFYLDKNPQQFFSSDLKPLQTINELIRMKVQKDLAGVSTEDIANSSFTKDSFINNIVNKIWNFIMSLFKDKLVKTNKIAEEVKDYIKGLDIKQVDSELDEILGLAAQRQNEINYGLKATQILSSDRAKQVFEKGEKFDWDLNKILSELQIPKPQKELIKSFNTEDREKIIANLLANYSYTIEINTAKIETERLSSDKRGTFQKDGIQYIDSSGVFFKEDKNQKLVKISKEEYNSAFSEIYNKPTQYYSNLTVPGGTNYIENEISTPLITPSIKGHAQFSTDNGIGWFRSDDRLAEDTKTDNIDGTITDYTGYNVNKIPSGYTIYNKNRGWLRDATGKPLDFKTEKEASDYLNKLINQGITNNSSIITKNDKIIFGHPTIGKSYLKQKGSNDFITLDDDYANEVNAFVDKNRGSETRQEYKGRKPKEYNEFMLNLFDRLKVQAKKEGKRLFVSNTNILKERMSEFDKVITIPKDEFKKRFDARGATYGFEDWKSDIDATVAKVDKSKVISTTGYLSDLLEGNPKTRRILEVQSDIFQKGRDIKSPDEIINELKKSGELQIKCD